MGLEFSSLEAITYRVTTEFYEEGHQIFKVGDMTDKIYILAEGSIEAFVTIEDEDHELDILELPGCVLCQNSILIPETTMSYYARVTSD
jgi:CRP-like cAMP-binding protein